MQKNFTPYLAFGLFNFFLLCTQNIFAQITPQCPVPPPPGAESCQATCVYCDFNGYMGTNNGTPSGGNQVCGQITLHNDQWFGFVAGTQCITINIATANCEDGNGLQAAFFSACNQDAIVCNIGQAGGGGQPLLLSYCGFEPGNTYYLMVDGWVGDVCDYTIEVLDGSITPPPVGQAQPIQGPTKVCPGATAVYSIPEVENASQYKWTAPPGSKINGLSNTLTVPSSQGGNQVTITFGTSGGQVCVSASNACSSPTQVCLPIENKPIPPTIRPKVEVCFENRPFEWDEEPHTVLINPGTYTLTSSPYPSYLGCDSTVRQTIVIKSQIKNNIGPQFICEGSCFDFNGIKYCKAGGPFQERFISYQGCDSIVEFMVVVIPAQATIAPAGKIDCATPVLVLNGAGSTTNNNTSYTWNNAAWTQIGTDLTQTINAGGTYHFVVSNSQGIKTCRDTASITIAQNTTPPGVSIGGGGLNCVITSVELAANSNTSNVNYFWTGPSINFTNQNLKNPVVNQAGEYIVTATNPLNSCTSTASFTVLQDTLTPALNASAQTLTCLRKEITIDASTDTNLPFFEWVGPGISASNANTEDPVVALPGIYKVTVTDNNNGCANTKELLVIQDVAIPMLSAGPDQTITCKQPNITLQGSANTGNAPAVLNWTGAGITVSQQGQLQPVVKLPDTYILKIVNQENGCEKQDTVVIDENTVMPNAVAGADTIITCKHLQVGIGSNAVQGPQIIALWTGAGINAGNKNLFGFDVTQADLYELTVTDTINGCSASDFVQVSQNKIPPTANAGNDAVLTCNLANGIQLNGTGAPANVTYLWSGPGIGSNNETEQKPNITQSGDYVLVVTNPINGCTAQDAVSILKDNNVPLADAGDDLRLNCTIKQVDFDGSKSAAGPNISYKWTGPGIQGLDSVAISPKNISLAGTYKLTVFNSSNGCKNSDVLVVLMDTIAPTAKALAQLTLNCYNNGADTLDASASSAGPLFTYNWAGPGIGAANKNQQSPVVNQGGNYTLTVTNTGNTCSATAQVQVAEDLTKPIADAGADPTINCVVSTTTLGGNSSTGAKFAYEWVGVGIDTLNHQLKNPTVEKPGEYHLIVTNKENGCHSADTVTVLSTAVYPASSAGPDARLSCTTPSVKLDASASASGVGISYLWQGPGISIANEAQQSPTITQPGTYVIKVSNAANQCAARDTVLVAEDKKPPVADAPANLTLNCKVKTLELDAEKSSTGPTFTYNWTGADINAGNQNLQKPLIGKPGIYALTVTNTDNGCTATTLVNVTEDIVAPKASAGADALITCAKPDVELDGSASTSGIGFDLVWQGPGIVTSNVNLTKPTVSDSGRYVLTIVNKANFCTAEDVVLVFQNTEKPKAEAGADLTLTCAQTSVQLDGSKSQTGPGITYNWSGPGLLPGEATLISPKVDKMGIYRITVTDVANGCTSSDVVDVFEDFTPPVANAGPDKIITCNNSATGVAIDGSGSNLGSKFDLLWSGPGINAANAQEVKPVVLDTGTYVIRIQNKTNGCTQTDTVQVLKDQNIPIASAGADQVLNCKIKEITLDASSSTKLGGGVVYKWSGPDINTGNEGSDSPNVTKSGTYTITVQNTLTGCKSTDEVVVSLDLAKPALTITTDIITCAEPKGDLSATTNPAGCSFEWAGPDINSSNINSAVFTVSEGGIYTVTITAPNGCTNSATANMAVDANFPEGNAEGATLNCANNGTAIISGLVKTASASAQWQGPNNFKSDSMSISVTQAGLYTFLITSPNGCKRPIEVEVKTDYKAPEVSLLVPQKLTCNVPSLIINTGGTSVGPNFSYEWRTPDGRIVSGEKTLTPRVDKAGTYILLVTNLQNGCTTERDIKVENDPDVPVAFDLDLRHVRCFQQTNGIIQIKGVKGGVGPFVFSLDGGPNTDKNQYTNLPSGKYLLRLEDANGCELDTLVTINAPGPLLLNLGPDQKVQLGDSVTVKADLFHSTPIASMRWNAAPNCKTINNLCYEFTYLPTASFRHVLTVRDSNGCEVSDDVIIAVERTRLIYVANIFRPESNDPENYRLMVFGGKGVRKIRQWVIYDRWGSAVHDVRDFLPNDAAKAWDGKVKGEKATPAVYAWYLEAEFEDGAVEKFRGDVTLIR